MSGDALRESLGLMDGIGGAAYFLLRVALPETPSMLTLHPSMSSDGHMPGTSSSAVPKSRSW